MYQDSILQRNSEGKNFGIFVRFLMIFGLAEATPRRKYLYVGSMFLMVLLHFAIIDSSVIYFMVSAENWMSWKINMGYIASQLFHILSWHSLRYERKRIIPLMLKIERLNKSDTKNKINICVAISVCYYFILYPSVSLVLLGDESTVLEYFLYGLSLKSDLLKNVVFFIKTMIQVSVFQFLNALMIILYLAISYNAAKSLEEFEKDLISAATEDIFSSRTDFAQRYIKILSTLIEIQRVFSRSSFGLCLSYIAVSFTCLAAFLLLSNIITSLIKFIYISIFLVSAISLLSIFYFAGRIPIKMTNIRSVFYAKYTEDTSVFPRTCLEGNLIPLKKLVDLPEITLSGCDVVYYTKMNIFSAIGSFVTYSLLLLQFDNRDISLTHK
ncbi:hypothetical protein TNCT_466881 [Trichonephila clavata]|uniref:Uncharacterized protein n=1 Tax=Trichonephila clavata TaxID=2740835 RepID=A0A8X6GH49_TRICU|nr:hypothetical protein TNCT_500711 [Trichonephila clavata]GFR03029.1 hypothetical protein TNCT_466881 [Trichonephila clavata]